MARSAAEYVAFAKEKKGAVVGWRNGQFVYLPPEQTFAEPNKFCRSQGEPFVVSRNRLYKELDADRLIEHDRDDLTKAVNVGGCTKRMIALRPSLPGIRSSAARRDRRDVLNSFQEIDSLWTPRPQRR